MDLEQLFPVTRRRRVTASAATAREPVATGSTSRKRVLHVTGSMDDLMGGLQSAVVAMANAQSRAGHEVVIASGQVDGGAYTGLEQVDAGVQVLLLPYSRSTRRFAGSRALRRWLSENAGDFDAVHVHSMWSIPTVVASLIALRRKTRLIISPHGSLEPYDVRKHARQKQVLGPLFIRPLLNRASTVLCTTHREADGMVTYGADPRLASLPLPPGAPSRPGRTREAFRAAYDVPLDAPLILFLGRLDEKKGLHVLVDALAHVPRELGAHLMVVGRGEAPYEAAIRAQVTSTGLDDRIIFAGWLSGTDKADAFHAADLFALLSFNENFGITVVEAAQAHLPVLLTRDVYASPELLEFGAAVATTRDPVEAGAALAELIGSPDRLQTMRDGARSYSEQYLDERRSQTLYGDLVT